MAVNHYFQGGDGIGSQNEKRLIEDLIVENLKIYGHAVYYLPRTLVNRDLILGEDSASRFDESYLVEMYFETVEGFQGEQEIISKFGLEVRDDTTFVIAKRRFQEQVDDPANLMVDGRPNEGDVIYYPLMNSFFEIQFVEDLKLLNILVKNLIQVFLILILLMIENHLIQVYNINSDLKMVH